MQKRVSYLSEGGFSRNLFEIVTVPALEKESVFARVSSDDAIDLMAFSMAQSETTYARWYEVVNWAKDKGYKFANPGREGNAGRDGAAPAGSNLPVTMISWRDAVVWCNAASEKDGLSPVYKYNGAVLKEADSAKDGEGTFSLPHPTKTDVAIIPHKPKTKAFFNISKPLSFLFYKF